MDKTQEIQLLLLINGIIDGIQRLPIWIPPDLRQKISQFEFFAAGLQPPDPPPGTFTVSFQIEENAHLRERQP